MSIFEKLEPRILLSADLLPIPAESLTEPLGFDNTPPLDQPEAVDSSPASLAPPSPAPEDPDSLEATPGVLSNAEPDPQAAPSAAPTVAEPDGLQPAEDENSVENSGIASGAATTAPEEATTASGEATTAEHTVLPAEPTETSEDTNTSTTEIVFVNDDIEDSGQLLEGLSQYHAESHVFILDSSIDGITQVSDILADYDQIDAVHFFTHGTEGNIKIGSDWLNKESVAPHSDQISSWNTSLRDNGDLMFYGCDVAATPEGQELLADIAELTSVDIAASTDTTGHWTQGGDWILEYQLGEIETSVPLPDHLQESWQHIMAAETVGDDFDTIAYDNNSGTVTWLGDWTEVGDDTDPSAGNIFIDSNRLQFKTAISSDTQRAIFRTADLSSAVSAFIRFDYEQQIIEQGHIGDVVLQIRTAASDPWVTIGDYTINGNLTASELIDITPYISSTTQIQFSSTGKDNPDGLSKGEDNFFVDNLRIDFNTNVAPTASNLSLVEAYTEDTPKDIADIVINDVDGGSLYTATLTLSDTAAGSFNTAAVGSASSSFSSGVLTVTGTNLADVNALLAGVTFSPTLNFDSDFAIATSVTDGDSAPITGSRTMNGIAVNDAVLASNINYGDPFTEDTAYVLRPITVTDPDSPESITVTLTLENPLYGSLTTSSGGTFNAATGEWRLTDTLANINSALATITYIPTANFSQDTAIDVRFEDGLEDGAPAQTGRIDLTATPVGDTPAVSSISTDAGVMTGSIFVLPNPSDGPEVTHFQIINITNGSLFQQDGIAPILNNDFITLTQGRDGLKFLPYSGANGSFGVQSSENGSTVAAQSDVAISVISINPSEGGPSVIDPVVEEPELPGEPAGEDDTGEVDIGEVAIDEVAIDEVDTGEESPQPEISPVDITLEIATGQPGPEINPTEPEIDLTEPAASSAESAGETQEETAPSAEPTPAAPTLVAEFYHTTSVAESLAGNLLQNANLLSTNLDFRNFALTASFLNESNEFTANDSILADGDKTVSPMQPAEDTLLNLHFRQRMNLEYDYIKSSLDAFREETQHEGVFGRTVVGSAIAASTSLSAGYVIWLLRSGALISSLLSSLPAWQFTDPLAILAGRHREDEEQDEDDSLESIVAGKQKDKDKPVG